MLVICKQTHINNVYQPHCLVNYCSQWLKLSFSWGSVALQLMQCNSQFMWALCVLFRRAYTVSLTLIWIPSLDSSFCLGKHSHPHHLLFLWKRAVIILQPCFPGWKCIYPGRTNPIQNKEPIMNQRTSAKWGKTSDTNEKEGRKGTVGRNPSLAVVQIRFCWLALLSHWDRIWHMFV